MQLETQWIAIILKNLNPRHSVEGYIFGAVRILSSSLLFHTTLKTVTLHPSSGVTRCMKRTTIFTTTTTKQNQKIDLSRIAHPALGAGFLPENPHPLSPSLPSVSLRLRHHSDSVGQVGRVLRSCWTRRGGVQHDCGPHVGPKTNRTRRRTGWADRTGHLVLRRRGFDSVTTKKTVPALPNTNLRLLLGKT